MTAKRVYLSPPHLSGGELVRLEETIASNWIAPLGPEVDAFEREFAARVGVDHAAALSSGTAALHLALEILGVGPGDEVLCSDLTFAASANAITYLGAKPVFIDADPTTWNLDPELLRRELEACAARNGMPAAVLTVDLYGQSADHEAIREACAPWQIPIVEDAAEALGATYHGVSVGRFGRFGAFSFNGNKILTTSGGGMLVSDDEEGIARARFLASQARDSAPHYEHSVVGYNYRLSNLLAAVGRAQLEVLDDRVAARRRNFSIYDERLSDLPGLRFMPEADFGTATRWLTCLTIDPRAFGADREAVRLALEAENIESRPVWKPMHLQPVFAGCRVRGGDVSRRLFEQGLCLPSGSSLSSEDLERVVSVVRSQCPHV